MSFDSRYSLSVVAGSPNKGYSGIPAQNLGTCKHEKSQEIDRKTIPWQYSYEGPQGGTNGTTKPPMWTDGDTLLCKKAGTWVYYRENSGWGGGENTITKTIGRYSSPLIRTELKKSNNPLMTENDLLSDVDFVSDSCDLRGTTIEALPKLKSVGANLTLDTGSKLKSLPKLKEVKGKISVIAKNKDDMNNYLRMLGLTDGYNRPRIPVKNGIEFVMKSYI